MIRDYAPKSALSNKPPQNAALYAAGKAAMLSALNYWHVLTDDPKNLGYLEKSTTILVPAGRAGSFPNIPTTSLAISKYSNNKKAAWLYIAWMTQKHIMLAGKKLLYRCAGSHLGPMHPIILLHLHGENQLKSLPTMDRNCETPSHCNWSNT